MDLINFFINNWKHVQVAPGPFITLSALALIFGATAAHFFFKHRIDGLKERIETLKEKLAGAENRLAGVALGSAKEQSEPVFTFPEAGFYGANILATGVPEIFVDREYSMTATIPTGSKLRVYLSGPRPTYIGDNMGAWVYALPPRNWIGTTYDQENQSQWFEADMGTADLKFIPKRAGQIEVVVNEGGRNPAWTKTIRVREC